MTKGSLLEHMQRKDGFETLRTGVESNQYKEIHFAFGEIILKWHFAEQSRLNDSKFLKFN